MTEQVPEVQGSVEAPTTDTPVEQQSNGNPWDSYLEPLPESVRPLVEPAFKSWDAEVTKRFQSLHSEYEPYKSFIDEYEPDAIGQALSIMQQLESDPASVIAAIQNAYGLNAEQGTADSPAEPAQTDTPASDDDPYSARFSQMEEMLGALAQALLGEQEQKQQAAEEQQLEQVLTDLKTKHGDYDEVYVLTLMAQGMDPEAAVQQFQSTVGQYAQQLNAPNAQAPQVVPANGGYPTNPITPEDLSSEKATKDLIVQMLQAAAEQQK